METETLEYKIAKLPEKLKLKVEEYVDTLLDYKANSEPIIGAPNKKYAKSSEVRPVFGSGKGIFGKMADDFDEPIEDMKAYM
jgi:hypothetical protein